MILEFTMDGIKGAVIVSRINNHFVYMDKPVTDIPPVPVPSGDYKPLLFNCGTGGNNVPVSPVSLYKFVVPAGTYNAVYVAYQQSLSGRWSEQVVIKKDGNITKADYDALRANVPATGSLHSAGENDLWYGLSHSGDSMGTTIQIKNSPDGVIKRVGSQTIFSRDVTFTMILVAGDVGPNKLPSGATHKVRFCYVP